MPAENPGPVFGISFGSDNAYLALWKDGRAEVFANEDGDRFTPQAVAILNGEKLTGSQGLHQYIRDPSSVALRFKNLLGLSWAEAQEHHHVGSFVESPEGPVVQLSEESKFTSFQLCVIMFKKLLVTASSFVGRAPAGCVIGYPADFNLEQRKQLVAAATEAGWPVLAVSPEASLAVLTGAWDASAGAAPASTNDEEAASTPSGPISSTTYTLAVDMGATGTCVSLFATRCGLLSLVKQTVVHVGGNEIDSKLFTFFSLEFSKKTKTNVGDLSKKSRAKLLDACENAKKALSQSPSANVVVESLHEGHDLNSNINRLRFDTLASSVFNRVAAEIEDLLEGAGITPETVKEVILLGGGAKMAKFSSTVVSVLPNARVAGGPSPDERIAVGAALEAGRLQNARLHHHHQQANGHVAEEADLGGSITVNGLSKSLLLEGANLVLFDRGTALPCKRILRVSAKGGLFKVIEEGSTTPVAEVVIPAGKDGEVRVGISKEAKVVIEHWSAGALVKRY